MVLKQKELDTSQFSVIAKKIESPMRQHTKKFTQHSS